MLESAGGNSKAIRVELQIKLTNQLTSGLEVRTVVSVL